MKKIFLILFLLPLFAEFSTAQQTEPFQKGDRIVFTGNSITDGGHYHSYIWLYYMTRFPESKIQIFNAGIGGDATREMARRFDLDVLSRKPNRIFLTFGMNDSGYFEYLQDNADAFAKERVRVSLENYKIIEKKMQALKRVKNVLMTSSPYDETTKGRGNLFPKKSLTMLEIAAFQEKSARDNNWDFIDLNRSMTALNLEGQKQDSTFTLCGGDRIHPDNDGHLVMAYFILKSQGLAGKEVADVQIDATRAAVEKAGNCSVTDLVASGEGVSFNYLARSLPFPLDTVARGWGASKNAADALKIIPFTEEMNREMLSVKGLKAGNYLLKIDGVEIGNWTAAEFDQGINLALQVKTPQYRQAADIMALNEKRWEIERRLRTYNAIQFNFFMERGLLYADDERAVDTLRKYAHLNPFFGVEFYQTARFRQVRDSWEKEMDALVNIIYSINKPRKHRIELLPV